MAIGAHELLLIVRAQNQASALLGRVGRDFRRLQNQRSLEMQRSQIMQRMAKNALSTQAQMARIQSVMTAEGKVRLQHEQNVARVLNQEMNIENRIKNLEIRRTAVARAMVNLEVQKMRVLQAEAGIEGKLAAIEQRRSQVGVQASRLGGQILRNMGQQNALRRQAYSLDTQLMQRELAHQKAISATNRMAAMGKGGTAYKAAQTQEEIARRRVIETRMAISEVPGRQAELRTAASTLNKQIPILAGQLAELKRKEVETAASANLLAKRMEGLNLQMQNLQARNTAVNLTEAELNQQLAVTARQLRLVNAAWEEQAAAAEAAAIAVQHNVDTQKMLEIQLAETNAMMAAQGAERMQTYARTVSHLGRVFTATGLVGTAMFAALGVSAAHFNTLAVRAATQVGDIGISANQVVSNAGRIEDAIINLMMTIPANSTELTDALYYIYSTLNTTLGQGTKLLGAFSEAWVAGGMVGSVEDVSKAIVTLANNWGVAATDMAEFEKIANSTTATVRFGGLDLEQYTQTMNQLAPSFRAANQPIEQMNGALAFLSRMLPSAGVSATGIARMMDQLARFAARPKEGFEELSKSIQDSNGNLLPLDVVIGKIIDKMPELKTSGVALNNVFKTLTGNLATAEARKAFQAFVKNFEEYRRILHLTSGDTKELQRASKAMRESSGFKWDLFINQMHAFALELGKQVIPTLLQAVEPLQRLAKWFHGLSEEQKRSIGQWLAYAAIITLVVGVLGSIAGGLALFIMSLRTIGKVLGILGPVVAKNGAAFEGLAGDAGAVSMRMSGMLGSIGLLLVAFPLLLKITGDWSSSLEILFAVMAAGKLAKIVSGFGMLDMTLGKGRVSANLLKSSMLGLRTASLGEVAAIVILSLEVEKLIRKIPGWDNAWKKFGETIYNALNPDIKDVNVGVKNLKQIRDEIRNPPKEDKPWWRGIASGNLPGINLSEKLFPKDKKSFLPDQQLFQQDLDRITQLLVMWRNNPALKMSDEEKKKRIQELMPELNDDFVRVMISQARRHLKAAALAAQNALLPPGPGGPGGGGPIAGVGVQPFALTPGFLDSIRQAYKLKQQLEKAPNLAAAKRALQAYNTFVTTATKGMTKENKAMWEELLGMMDNFPQPTKALSAIIAAAKHVEELHKAALTAGADISLWDKYWAALEKLNKLGTPDQISKANEFLQAQGDIATHSTGEILKMAEAVQKLQEAYDLMPTDLGRSQALQDARKALDAASTPDQRAVVDPVVAAQAAARATALENKPIVSQDKINQMVAQRDALKAAAEAAPKDISAWTAYFDMVDQLQKTAKGNQLEIADAMREALGDIPRMSNSAALRMARQLERLRKAAEKAPSMANWLRFFKFQEQYTKQVTAMQQQLNDAIVNSDQERADKQQEIADKARQDAIQRMEEAQQQLKSATSTLLGIYNEALQQYKGFLGTIFSGRYMQSAYMQDKMKFGFSASPEDLLKDMQMTVKQAETFSGSLDKLRKRGAPTELVSQVAALGPEAQKQIETLLRMEPGDWKKYVDAFKTAQSDSQKYAKAEMDRKVKEWLQFGKDVAFAILTGIRSETPLIEDAIMSMIKRLYPGVAATAAGAGVPGETTTTTTKTAGGRQAGQMPRGFGLNMLPGGKYLDAGTGKLITEPFNQYSRAFTVPGPTSLALAKAVAAGQGHNGVVASSVVDKYTRRTSSVSPGAYDRKTRQISSAGTTHNVTYNIHPKEQGEGLESMLRRSHFYYRNRKTNL